MKPVFEKTLKHEIKTGSLSSVYILFGDDSYLKKHYSDQIIDAACGEDTDFNLQTFEQSAEMQNVYEAVNQFPIMAEKRCVVLNDYDIEHADKTEFDRLCEILSDIPDTTVFVLRFDSVPFDIKKGARAKKIISSAEKSGGKAVNLGHRDEIDLVSMLCRGAKSRGLFLSPENAKYMIISSGGDINTLRNELDKLCLYVSSGDISKDIIDLVCTKTVDASVYDYVRAIISLNITRALSILDDMFYMRVEPISILFSISSCYIDMYRLYSAKRSKVLKESVIEDFGYANKTFVVDNAERNLRRFNFKKLKQSLELLLKTDKELKSFAGNERLLLEELTIKLGSIIASEDKN